MFENVFFLIVALLVIALAPDNGGSAWVASPVEAFLWGLLGYGALLGIIYFQNRLWKRRSWLPTLVNCELILFLIVYHFVLHAQAFFATLPLLLDIQGIVVLFSLLLYLGGLGWYHYTAHPHASTHAKVHAPTACRYAMMQLRLLIPFTLPFIGLTFLLDLFRLYLVEGWNGTALVVLLFTTAVMILGIVLFFPPLIQKIWHCEPLPESELKERLDTLCKRARFRHGGLKTWTVMNHALTAAIIGVIAPFRYVMFTKRLIDELPAPAIEAILAHEIGHQQRKHLLIYPLIIFGLMITTGLFSLFFAPSLIDYLKHQQVEYLGPFAIFLPYVIIIALYFRIIYGHFSRLFERQADLHVFALQVSPNSMIHALDFVAKASGNSHHTPCWHHFSIQQRIDFLNAASDNRLLITAHDKKVRRNLWIYLVIMGMGALFLLAPLFPGTYPFKTMNRFTETVHQDLNRLFIPKETN